MAFRYISIKLQDATGSHDGSVIAGSHVVAVNRLTCVSLAVRDVTHTHTAFVCKCGISGRRFQLLKCVNSDIHMTHRAIASDLLYISPSLQYVM
jgi:hypothetical protein